MSQSFKFVFIIYYESNSATFLTPILLMKSRSFELLKGFYVGIITPFGCLLDTEVARGHFKQNSQSTQGSIHRNTSTPFQHF